jgi:hypothetical protein
MVKLVSAAFTDAMCKHRRVAVNILGKCVHMLSTAMSVLGGHISSFREPDTAPIAASAAAAATAVRIAAAAAVAAAVVAAAVVAAAAVAAAAAV